MQRLDLQDSDRHAWGNPAGVFVLLTGQWYLDRSIEGHSTMQGHAAFTPSGDGRLHYREHGTLVLANGTALEAQREYLYAVGDNGFSVFFHEKPPRLFHAIALVANSHREFVGEADHPCAEDHYRSFYRFMPDGRFIIRHVVTGPRKGYTMITTYTQVARWT